MTIKIETIIYDNVQDIDARNELLVAHRRQAARIAELEAFARKFLDNLEDCDYCGGKGYIGTDGIECPSCHGKEKQIVSSGVMYVELPDEARELLKGAS